MRDAPDLQKGKREKGKDWTEKWEVWGKQAKEREGREEKLKLWSADEILLYCFRSPIKKRVRAGESVHAK